MRASKVSLVALFAIFAALALIVFVLEPMTWKWRVRRESLSILGAATSTNVLLEAVGHLGIFISLQDGSWIAIRYRDTHGGRIDSMAIARDSGGGWFESTEHFCDTFSVYKRERARQEQARAEVTQLGVSDTDGITGSRPDRWIALDALHTAPSLEEGRNGLLRLGLVPIKQ